MIVPAGRQWTFVIKDWQMNTYGSDRAGVKQFFYRKEYHECIIIVMVKVVDDFLIAGTQAAIEWFLMYKYERFKLCRLEKEAKLKFSGCHISKSEDWYMILSMNLYLERILTISILRYRQSELSERADEFGPTLSKFSRYTVVLKAIVFLQANLAASKMQQRLGSLWSSDNLEAICVVGEWFYLKSAILFRNVYGIKIVSKLTFSDAFHARLR